MRWKNITRVARVVIPSLLLPVLSGCGHGGGGGAVRESYDWTPPATAADGSPLDPADIAGYKIYYGTSPGLYSGDIDIGKTTSFRIASLNLPHGATYYVAVAVYARGCESDPSNEVTIRLN